MIPPNVHQGRQELPPGASNLIVLTGIPAEAKENDVKMLCQGAGGGEVTKIAYRVADQEGLGWAFVVFATPEQAHHARDRLDGKTIGGYIFKQPVRASVGEGLYGEVKKAAPGDQSMGEWQQYKTPDGRPYWHNKTTKQTTWTRPALQMAGIQTSASAVASKSIAGPVGANLFVYHVPNSWDDSILKQHFEHFGKIMSCAIQRDNEGRSKGFGFISYETQQAATAAIAGMNGFPVEGKWLKVQIKKGDEMMIKDDMGKSAPKSAPPQTPGPVASTLASTPAPAPPPAPPPPPPPKANPPAVTVPAQPPALGLPDPGFGPMKPGMIAPRPGPY
eukprot:gnl/MRDRNA2_/MRDRNA2_112043_c0_seq1.p1 gnl/MRDRNA2_/MRDRNA2_112043_c0~~gnl/MRDRNA2_/MRDRNA2_112043_c0_seq1.p1  ORF type:complete len:360 (-),score=63.57 gnl/MRDRNA2_/MRDRNA2_112043_c0_seq1:38-1033(-)